MTKKSYNPFKMWGSYVGLILGIILTRMNWFTGLFFGESSEGTGLFLVIMWAYFIGILILGFLIGWGIHSLVRKFR